MKKMLMFPLIFLSTVVFSQASLAIDCATAKTSVEKAICEDSRLLKYDALVDETFQKKKADPQFKNDYLSWLKERDLCNESNEITAFCLRKKYASMVALILNKYNGFVTPFIPDADCFKPLLPYANGDQGFYAVRVISPIRGCDNLNFKLITGEDNIIPRIKFLNMKDNIYYYEYWEDSKDERYSYKVGVRFDLKYVTWRNVREPTLIMSLIEAS